MKPIALLLSLFLSFFASRAFATDPDYYLLMEKSDKAIAEGHWTEAEDALRQALRLEPANPSNILLLSNLGMIQFYDGRSDDAIATLTMAHRMAPNSVTVLQNRAKVYNSTGMIDQARMDYDQVIRLDSTLIEPRFYRAMISLHQGNFAAADSMVRTIEQMAPSSRLANAGRGLLYMSKAEFANAVPCLTSVIKDDPDPSYIGSRAFCYLMLGELGQASEDIARAIELDPTDGELYLYRAMLNKMRYRPDDAQADADRARQFGVSAQTIDRLLK